MASCEMEAHPEPTAGEQSSPAAKKVVVKTDSKTNVIPALGKAITDKVKDTMESLESNSTDNSPQRKSSIK